MLSDENKTLLERTLFTAAPLVALLLFFIRWAVADAPQNIESLLLAAAVLFLFALLGIRFIPVWMRAWSGAPEIDAHASDGKRSNRPQVMHPFFKIVFGLLLYRIALLVVAYLIAFERGSFTGGIFDSLSLWNPGSLDSRHYLYIAENWYAAAGDARLLIVFFPLYPLLVRMLNPIFESYLVSGMFVSNLCAVFSGYLLYELALLDHDRYTAMRTVKYLCILPAAILFTAPMSDSLFLLLSILTVYFARRKRYPVAAAFGFLAAFSRLLGILLLVPVLFEFIADIVRDKKNGASGTPYSLACLANGLSLLLIPMGLGLYLYINYRVSGNAFQFMVYEREHWSQQLGWFFASTATQTDFLLSALEEGDLAQVVGLWLPNLVFALGSLGLLAAAVKKLRASHTAYFIIYYLFGMGATWLLSAPRYLTALYPVSLALGVITDKRWADALLTVLCIAGLLIYLYAFIQRWDVY